MDAQPVHGLIAAALARGEAELARAAPLVARRVAAWTDALAGGRSPEAYFLHPRAFPSLLLPWWLEQMLAPEPDLSLQSELIYSTANGYYFIRLIDNVMDGEATMEQGLLPTLGIFHTRFQSVYHQYFPYGHPFWEHFNAVWFGTAQAAVHDASLAEIDLLQFRQVASQKVSAAKIPVAAVCHRYAREDLIAPWSAFIDLLGAWHQMCNDLFDWHKDSTHRNPTYFLSEASRRSAPGEQLADWVIREGFAWGCRTLDGWMRDARACAAALASPPLCAYLSRRQAAFAEQRDLALAGLRGLGRLAERLRAVPGG